MSEPLTTRDNTENEMTNKRKAELQAMIILMERVSSLFYGNATAIGNHAFIEFCGLMNEYIKVCQGALAQGIDFTLANTHTGVALPLQPYHVSYLAEKLDCIYGASLRANERLLAMLV